MVIKEGGLQLDGLGSLINGELFCNGYIVHGKLCERYLNFTGEISKHACSA